MKALDATNTTYVGLSTDPKPHFVNGAVEGDTFLEEDTGKVAILKADDNYAYL